jgi:hypothetical protein
MWGAFSVAHSACPPAEIVGAEIYRDGKGSPRSHSYGAVPNSEQELVPTVASKYSNSCAVGGPMRSSEECLLKAAEMDALAETCKSVADATQYKAMAHSWRDLARQAAEHNNPPH